MTFVEARIESANEEPFAGASLVAEAVAAGGTSVALVPPVAAPDAKGATPLHTCAWVGDVEQCAWLVNVCPADVHARNNRGSTPLRGVTSTHATSMDTRPSPGQYSLATQPPPLSCVASGALSDPRPVLVPVQYSSSSSIVVRSSSVDGRGCGSVVATLRN